jgi:hypothetical protein
LIDPNQPPEVDAAQLAKPSQRVQVRNTHPKQINVVIDRYRQPHPLRPGEVKEVEMLVADIESFRRYRQPGRFRSMLIQEGAIYHMATREAPQHPVVIEDIPQLTEPAEAEPSEQAMRRRRPINSEA